MTTSAVPVFHFVRQVRRGEAPAFRASWIVRGVGATDVYTSSPRPSEAEATARARLWLQRHPSQLDTTERPA